MAEGKKRPGKPNLVSSSSRAVVPVGPRQIVGNQHRKHDSERPTTTRALVLRNGKYGARGTGEVMLLTKISGREKLDLLAEDLIEKSKKAVLSPFYLERCLKLSQSQFNAFLDEINVLQDPETFQPAIETEYRARTLPNQKRADASRTPSHIAAIIGTRIHNVYMLASAWKIVVDTLEELEDDGLNDKAAQLQLKENEHLRSRFLVLYDMVTTLVDASQTKFSVLATTTPHYAHYFKQVEGTNLNNPEIIFDWDGIREACKSFLDSIIIELCFPRETYSKAILYQILHDAVDESPHEAKRFPQALWDAVGDLSVTVELQTMLERLLVGPDGEAMKNLPRQMPEAYEQWIDAQLYSERAAEKCTNYKDIVYPLEKTRDKHVLETMWKLVDLNYKSVSGMDIDALWQLTDARQRIPHWHAFYAPDKPQKELKAITDGTPDAGYESSSSMPDLESVSSSSEEELDYSSENDESVADDDDDDEDDDESGYDTDQEDQAREMWREAMDMAAEVPDFYDPQRAAVPDFDQMAQERKGNPFIKLLGSLRGRVFNSNPKLKTATRSQPRDVNLAARGTASKTAKQFSAEGGDIPSLKPISERPVGAQTKTQPPKSHKATVEEVEDEDQVPHAPKKKKKKPKKKKKASAAAIAVTTELTHPLVQEAPHGRTTLANDPKPPQLPTAPPTSPSQKGHSTAREKSPIPSSSSTSNNFARSAAVLPHMSTTSLPLPAEQIAQSARSYLQNEKVQGPKTKVKSRPDHASLFSVPEKRDGFFSRFSGKDKNKDIEGEKKGSKHSWFERLGKKTKTYMHQLLNTTEDETKGLGSMKWENFLKVMREMGFEYDPSTAGSSVRFHPPDKRDRSISFHKPHPDPTLPREKIRQFGKKLKEYYDWSEEDFEKHMK